MIFARPYVSWASSSAISSVENYKTFSDICHVACLPLPVHFASCSTCPILITGLWTCFCPMIDVRAGQPLNDMYLVRMNHKAALAWSQTSQSLWMNLGGLHGNTKQQPDCWPQLAGRALREPHIPDFLGSWNLVCSTHADFFSVAFSCRSRGTRPSILINKGIHSVRKTHKNQLPCTSSRYIAPSTI